jgi:hypothetical protein
MNSENAPVIGKTGKNTRYMGKYQRNDPFLEAVYSQEELARGPA